MDKTIENKFFDAFNKRGGVVGKCIYWMREIYNLPEYFNLDTLKYDKTPEDEDLKRLQAEILEATEAFDDSVIMGDKSPLMDEIEDNLNECSTEAQRYRYVYSLLMPFGSTSTGCGIADICNPIGVIEYRKKEIEHCKNTIDDLQHSIDSALSSEDREKQINALTRGIYLLEEMIEWASKICDKFGEYLFCSNVERGSVEYCLSHFIIVLERYSNRLDALLLTFGIDLMRVQKDCGVYLKDKRRIDDIFFYIGNRELTQKYIDALPEESKVGVLPDELNKPTARPEAVTLPDELATPEALKIFEQARELGLIDKDYKWLKGLQLAACFARDMSLKLGLGKGESSGRIPRISWQPFERLFNIPKGKLRANYNDVLKTGQDPSDHALIDRIFK